jgi:hypothetical protein
MATTTVKAVQIIETSNFFQALYKNQRLRSPAFWKKLQQLVITLMGIAPFLKYIFPKYSELLDAGFLASVEGALGTISTYLQFATTGELGRTPK